MTTDHLLSSRFSLASILYWSSSAICRISLIEQAGRSYDDSPIFRDEEGVVLFWFSSSFRPPRHGRGVTPGGLYYLLNWLLCWLPS